MRGCGPWPGGRRKRPCVKRAARRYIIEPTIARTHSSSPPLRTRITGAPRACRPKTGLGSRFHAPPHVRQNLCRSRMNPTEEAHVPQMSRGVRSARERRPLARRVAPLLQHHHLAARIVISRHQTTDIDATCHATPMRVQTIPGDPVPIALPLAVEEGALDAGRGLRCRTVAAFTDGAVRPVRSHRLCSSDRSR